MVDKVSGDNDDGDESVILDGEPVSSSDSDSNRNDWTVSVQ